MKHKGKCTDCGILVVTSKLHPSKKDSRLLCKMCDRSERKLINIQKERITPSTPEINSFSNKVWEKPKSLLKRSELIKNQYLTKDEKMFISDKYKDDDSLIRGTKEREALDRLNDGLAATRKKRIAEGKRQAMDIDLTNRENSSMNKNLIEGLK